MNPLGLAIGGASSLLGGLFGRRGANPWEGDFKGAMSTLDSSRNAYNDLARSNGAAYNTWDPQYNASVRQRVRDLSVDPYTDAYSTAALNRATAGSSAAYNAAKANLDADMAARGITGSGMQVGGLAAINAARAGTFANAQNNLAMQKVAQRQANADQILQLLAGARQNALSGYLTGLGAVNGIDQYRTGMYANLMGAENARRQQQSDNLANVFGQIGSGLGDYFFGGGRVVAPGGAGGSGGTGGMNYVLPDSTAKTSSTTEYGFGRGL